MNVFSKLWAGLWRKPDESELAALHPGLPEVELKRSLHNQTRRFYLWVAKH
jgi:hypothetical protein